MYRRDTLIPAVNVAIAALLWLGLAGLGGMTAWLPALAIGGSFVAQLLWINIVLVAFNLLPAFPMDGGRVLRALLATRMPRVRATRLAATVAQVFAIGFGVLGLFGNPMLILIAVFVFMAARAEAEHVEWTAEEQATGNIRALPAEHSLQCPFPLPERWAWSFLAQALVWDLTDGDWVESKDQDPDGEVRLIQLADVGIGDFKDKSARFLTSATAARLNCTYLSPSDVLIARLPSPLGRSCVFPGLQPFLVRWTPPLE